MKNKSYQLTAIILALFVIISISCRKSSMDDHDNNYLRLLGAQPIK